jgi:hypothetical protein
VADLRARVSQFIDLEISADEEPRRKVLDGKTNCLRCLDKAPVIEGLTPAIAGFRREQFSTHIVVE